MVAQLMRKALGTSRPQPAAVSTRSAAPSLSFSLSAVFAPLCCSVVNLGCPRTQLIARLKFGTCTERGCAAHKLASELRNHLGLCWDVFQVSRWAPRARQKGVRLRPFRLCRSHVVKLHPGSSSCWTSCAREFARSPRVTPVALVTDCLVTFVSAASRGMPRHCDASRSKNEEGDGGLDAHALAHSRWQGNPEFLISPVRGPGSGSNLFCAASPAGALLSNTSLEPLGAGGATREPPEASSASIHGGSWHYDRGAPPPDIAASGVEPRTLCFGAGLPLAPGRGASTSTHAQQGALLCEWRAASAHSAMASRQRRGATN